MERKELEEKTAQLIADICDREWEMFDAVNNTGGRASCQNDPVFFKKMRACQFAGWDALTLASYLIDLEVAKAEGRNPLTEKYAYMMERTHPAEFENIKDHLQVVSTEKENIINGLVHIMLLWETEVDRLYPAMRSGGRPLTSDKDTPDVTSFETYLSGELKTYSERTLMHLAECVKSNLDANSNMALMVAEQTAIAYGFASIEDAEKAAQGGAAKSV